MIETQPGFGKLRVFLHPMLDLEKELRRAEEEMRAGSLDHAISILVSLQDALKSSTFHESLTEEERLQGLVKVLNNLGIVQKNLGALDEATGCLEEALEIASQLEHEAVRMRTGILSNLGLLYSRRKLYSRAQDAFNRAVELVKKNPEAITPSVVVKLRNNRALFFVRFGEPDKAREELAQAMEAGREATDHTSDNEREAWLNANLAMIHAELGDEEIYNPSVQEELFRQARTMFMRSADLYGQEGYTLNRLTQIVNAAEMDIRLRAPEEAKRLLEEARREAERLKDGRLLCEIAQITCEQALLTCDHEQILHRVREVLKILSDTNPTDLPSRIARLEGVLRRAGHHEALKLIADFRNSRDHDRNQRKRTPR